MPQIGPLEILVVAVVALIVFGPEKLPDLARKVGRTATELRRIANEAKAELQTDFSLDDDDEAAAPQRDRSRRPPGASARGTRATSSERVDERSPAETGPPDVRDDSDGPPKEG